MLIVSDLPVVITKDPVTGLMVAYCPFLELSTYGDSVEHAQKMFIEALDLFTETVTAQQNWDEVLTELGWTKTETEQDDSPKWTPPETKTITVPLQVCV